MKKHKKIIVFSGKQFSGKDTVAKIVLENLRTFKRIGIGDAIKILYSQKTNLSLEEIEKNKSIYRQDLIDLGDWGRAQDADYWLKSIINNEGDIVVTDIRLPHELNLFKSYSAFSVRVEANEEIRAKRGVLSSKNDLTETALDDFKNWDYVIYNNGTYDELNKNTQDLIKHIKNYFGEI